MSESNNNNFVEVVCPIETIWGICAFITFGMIIGVVIGLGISYFPMKELVERKPEIIGNLTVVANEKGCVISGMNIRNTQNTPAIYILDEIVPQSTLLPGE